MRISGSEVCMKFQAAFFLLLQVEAQEHADWQKLQQSSTGGLAKFCSMFFVHQSSTYATHRWEGPSWLSEPLLLHIGARTTSRRIQHNSRQPDICGNGVILLRKWRRF